MKRLLICISLIATGVEHLFMCLVAICISFLGKFLFKSAFVGVPVVAQWLMNPTRNHEVAGSVPGLAQWVKGSRLAVSVAVSCSVGCIQG